MMIKLFSRESPKLNSTSHINRRIREGKEGGRNPNKARERKIRYHLLFNLTLQGLKEEYIIWAHCN